MNLNRITPKSVEKVEHTLIKLKRSFKKKTPINKAKIILVSLNAVTSAIGACVNAHVTMPYARNDVPPPITKILRPLKAKSMRVLGFVNTR